MGRPREFDEDEVIDAARTAFWTRGVHDTSISDLSDATGLSVGSLYKAFGSKAALCELTLDTYLDAGVADVAAQLDGAGSPVAGLERWLDSVAEHAAGTEGPPGCYAVVCASELATIDDAVRQRLRRHDEQLRGVVASAIADAVRCGELRGDPEVGARLLCVAVNGVQLEARKGIELDDARSTLRLALNALR